MSLVLQAIHAQDDMDRAEEHLNGCLSELDPTLYGAKVEDWRLVHWYVSGDGVYQCGNEEGFADGIERIASAANLLEPGTGRELSPRVIPLPDGHTGLHFRWGDEKNVLIILSDALQGAP